MIRCRLCKENIFWMLNFQQELWNVKKKKEKNCDVDENFENPRSKHIFKNVMYNNMYLLISQMSCCVSIMLFSLL